MPPVVSLGNFPNDRERATSAILNTESHNPDEPLPSSALWPVVLKWIHQHGDGKCGICGTAVDLSLRNPHPASAQLDHIVPRSLGGADKWGNAQLTHANCNNAKNGGRRNYPTRAEAIALLVQAISEFENPTVESLKRKIKEREEIVEQLRLSAANRARMVQWYVERAPAYDASLDAERAAAKRAQQSHAKALRYLVSLQNRLSAMEGDVPMFLDGSV